MLNKLQQSQAHLERLDIQTRAAEIKWGVLMKLETLVDAELAGKFQRQWTALSEAITEGRHEDVCQLADGAIRGLWAMDKAAIDAGHTPAPLPPLMAAPTIIEQTVKFTAKEVKVTPGLFENGGDPLPF